MRVFYVLLFLMLISCGKKKKELFSGFQTVEVEVLLKDSTVNVRAMEIDKNYGGLFVDASGRRGLILRKVNNDKFEWETSALIIDSLENPINANIRAIELVNNTSFAISIGNPAKLFMNDSLIYFEKHPKVFYDSMAFWNDQEGIAMGDPTDNCLSVIITRNGGDSWEKLSCDQLPKTVEGEAAFAASDTNIAIVGDHTWLFSGGKQSRVFYSPDKGKRWLVYDTPIVQGEATQGIYSGAFYDKNRGIVVGGDYTQPAGNKGNKAITIDGGKTWQLVSDGIGIGYKSCVQYVPNSDARGLVAIGFTGIAHSADGGETWKELSEEGFYTLRFLNDSVAYAAGKGRIAKLSFR